MPPLISLGCGFDSTRLLSAKFEVVYDYTLDVPKLKCELSPK